RQSVVARRVFAAGPGLEIELAYALAQDGVRGVHRLVELEVVAQIAARPISRAERVFGDEKAAIEPACVAFPARLELRARFERLRVVHLAGELLRDRVVVVLLVFQTRRARRRRRLPPEPRKILVV